MARATLAEINRRIAKTCPHVELVRGEGYHYFAFDDAARPHLFETRSVMVPYLCQLPAARWIADAVEFSAEVEARDAEAAGPVAEAPVLRKVSRDRSTDVVTMSRGVRVWNA